MRAFVEFLKKEKEMNMILKDEERKEEKRERNCVNLSDGRRVFLVKRSIASVGAKRRRRREGRKERT
jgi:hypothetical protein